MSSPIEVIINAGSGSVEREETKRRLMELFQKNGLVADFNVVLVGDDIMKFARRAARSTSKIVVAGGGDGTINAIVSEILPTGKTLGILPLGTLNHFSKDLGIPQDLAAAVRVIAENHTTEVDVGEVNERIFVNNSSLGLYPSIVRKRAQQQERLGQSKWYAFFWATLAIFRRYPFLEVKLKIERRFMERRTPFVFVGNNEYEMHVFNIGGRKSLDEGLLSVYFLHKTGRMGLVRLLLRMIFGILREAEDFDEFLTDELRIDRERKKRMMVALDGEVTVMESPLIYKILPKALRVIVPNGKQEDN
jgi:YegS/Rv2252/BmrU family lipid kinase